MNILRRAAWTAILAAASLAAPIRTGSTEAEHAYCRAATQAAPARDASDFRKYAPDREIDILHVALDVTPDWKERRVTGSALIRFKPIAKAVERLRLDAVDLRVEAVSSTEPVQGYHADGDQLFVTFADPIPADREASVTIRYRATPRRGLYFRTPEQGYKPGDTHLWTQGEPIEARHWFPCYDAPNEKFTSEITCRVPEGMTVLSNGRRLSETKDAATGLVAVRWLQDKPHVNYLICLVAGYFNKLEDAHGNVPLAFYTPPSQFEHALNSFKDTKDMMAFFEREIGVPYPWAKYDQVVVDDFTAGGMENTTLTVLTDGTLHAAASETLRSSQGLVAHELAHQWFGNLVTCKDWSHLWLNEGFATYYDALYEEHKNGTDAMRYALYQSARGIINQPDQTNAIVRRDYSAPEEQFGYLAYPKGSWILHMLRSRLGPDLFRRCIQTYLERHQFGTVVTENLSAIIEELSGQSWDQFFDQYVYHASQPSLDIAYAWDERTRLARISVQQTQKLSEQVLLFNVPLTLRFKGPFGSIDRTLTVKETSEDFYFALPAAPQIVRLDPELALLAKLSFKPPAPMVYAQLADAADAIGRILAAEWLGERKEAAAVPKLHHALNHDPFHGVRSAAAGALRSIGTDAAYEALQSSLRQPDARVRQRVLQDLLRFYRESSMNAAISVIADEPNPDIRSSAIRALGAYSNPSTRDLLLDLLISESYRHALADAAISAMRAQDDARYVPAILETLRRDEAKFTSSSYGRALGALAFLARNEDQKDAPREFLLGHLRHPKDRIRVAAIQALGALGDPKAIAALETFAFEPKLSPDRGAAERAIANLRATRRPGEELGNLRGEVLELQKSNRELRRELEDLKKRLETLAAPPSQSKPAKQPAAPGTKKPRRGGDR